MFRHKKRKRKAIYSRRPVLIIAGLIVAAALSLLAFKFGEVAGRKATIADKQSLAYLSPKIPHHRIIEQTEPKDIIPPKETASLPAWQRYAVPFDQADQRPKIVVILDDMGVDRRRSHMALDLPGPMTFAFLPYAHDVAAMVAETREKNHEILVHVAMQPDNPLLDPGPLVLKKDMTPAQLVSMLEKNLSVFEGFVGFNNHMGSLLTADHEAMEIVMNQARERGLLFVDSRTSEDSVAASIARSYGVPTVERTVFLDHEETYASVERALEKAERIARRDGYAIAIGHPKDHTLEALRQWIPALEQKGFVLAPVSAVVTTSLPSAGSVLFRPD